MKQPSSNRKYSGDRKLLATIPELVRYLQKLREEVFAEVSADNEATYEDATRAANAAWTAALPIMGKRAHVPAYVACVAHGLQHGFLTAEQAKTMLYAAQMALATFPKAGAR